MKNIRLISGDITLAETDAIVNAANSFMLGGGGVDGAIHRAAGPSLLEECRKVPDIDGIRCPVGEAKITGAGNLKAKYVIHTVGPRHGVDRPESTLLRNAYRSSLDLALENHCASVAFPAISCGVYDYPIHEAASIALRVCAEEQYASMDIVFYLYPHDAYEAWDKVYQDMFEP